MQKSGIYKLLFKTGAFYIGQTVNLDIRKKEHYRLLLLGTHHNYKVQELYDNLKELPEFIVEIECNTSELNTHENTLIDLSNKFCLNIKAGGDSNFGYNALTSKYLSSDIELAFLLLVENPGILHKEVADFVGIDINTVHDISAGRNRAFTEMKELYPEKYSKLIKQKAANTRGKNTVVLQHVDGRIVKLISGEYSEFCRTNNVQTSNLSKVITGKRTSTMGWSLVEKYENI
jgi:hypothetical protein